MRAGWTLIELIFIIVIISILGVVAIGKLSTTRDDAKLSTVISNMHICLTDASNYYTSTKRDYSQADHPITCDESNTVCYDIVYSINGQDFNVSTDPTGTDSNNNTHSFCADIDNVGGHLAKSYDFGGQTITR